MASLGNILLGLLKIIACCGLRCCHRRYLLASSTLLSRAVVVAALLALRVFVLRQIGHGLDIRCGLTCLVILFVKLWVREDRLQIEDLVEGLTLQVSARESFFVSLINCESIRVNKSLGKGKELSHFDLS